LTCGILSGSVINYVMEGNLQLYYFCIRKKIFRMPSTIYGRDYSALTRDEEIEYQVAVQKRTVEGPGNLKLMKGSIWDYSKAARHHIHMFPGHYLDPADLRDRIPEFTVLIDEFKGVVHDKSKSERDILRFIKENQAYFIIGSIVKKGYTFGHHALYVFPEFELSAIYKADFLLVGKSSDGYQFLFVEFENSYGRITKADGDFGAALVKGIRQIELWQHFLGSEFATLSRIFQRALKNGDPSLPNEFYKYDATRMHFALVAGLRENFVLEASKQKRRDFDRRRIRVMHYDNLIEQARMALGSITY
jgi:hypothetical protein